MRRRRLLVVAVSLPIVAGALAAALLATGGSGTSRPATLQGSYRGSEPPPGIRMPSVVLPSYRGGTARLPAERGRVVVLTFLDSECTESCPVITAVIARAWPLLSAGERSKVRAYAVSVNPRVDTPARVRAFLAARHALTALDWLVAPIEQMRPVWKALGVVPAIDTGDNDLHSAPVRIFDPQGEWVSTLHAGVDLTQANLVHDIRRALRR
jgi:cytochrome oxidase Cu insertion factor (SCO1/SenC/PrrC family)